MAKIADRNINVQIKTAMFCGVTC